MVVSMTGFGKAAGEFEGKKITVEIKSLNSKIPDTKIRLPHAYRDKELEIRSQLAAKLGRGKIEFGVMIEQVGGIQAPKINQELAADYYKQLVQLSQHINEKPLDLLALVMRMPNVVDQEKFEVDEAEWAAVEKLIDTAFEEINQFRQDEGAELEKDLLLRLANIEEYLEKVFEIAPQRIEEKREKLNAKFADIKNENNTFDQNRFEQELIYYLEKFDITEERVRLQSHIDYFRINLKSPDSQGKKLGFITQEMGREINTIGSKANHAEMQQTVVLMKDDLEKIKEHVL